MRRWNKLLVLEDNSATSDRRRLAAVGGGLDRRVVVRVHEVRQGEGRLLATESYRAGTMVKRGAKAALALGLLDDVQPRSGAVVVAGSSYGSNGEFLAGLRKRGLSFVTEVRASELAAPPRDGLLGIAKVERLLKSASWRTVSVVSPTTGQTMKFAAAHISGAAPDVAADGHLFAAQTGGILGVHRGTILGFTSDRRDLQDLVGAVVWARWIRPVVRRSVRNGSDDRGPTRAVAAREAARLTVRANIALADRQDTRLDGIDEAAPVLRNVMGGRTRVLNVAELFAGAGGMGLGFLLASGRRPGYRVVFSGEVNPIYAATLRRNHEHVARHLSRPTRVPDETEPVDLRADWVRKAVRTVARRAGGVDVLIGGPPCQGFSNANRNSWSKENPNNRLVDVFLAYVEAIMPPVFIMENVQGILWTPTAARASGPVSVVDHLARRMRRVGYDVFPRLLDAVWYGVPQYRSRFFLVGVHRDLGYRAEDFGTWGPFPKPLFGAATGRPYRTVHDALADLPVLRNGEGELEAAYDEPSSRARRNNAFLGYVREGARKTVIFDHVTSRHSDYVIERYRRIPPGGNWEDIVDTMSNYADVERTHSNIYRRLASDQPAVTIGHYRKSMLVHPTQHRGLSLREAARLQSFPDWFRFAGRSDGGDGGLVHKQQQLANAVCPLVSKALAEFLLQL